MLQVQRQHVPKDHQDKTYGGDNQIQLEYQLAYKQNHITPVLNSMLPCHRSLQLVASGLTQEDVESF